MRKFSLLIYVSIIFINCEDPIDVSLNDTKEILVVEAFINWIKEDKTTEQEVNLSLSSPYFNNDFKAANNANVIIEDEQGNIFNFYEQGNSGRYLTNDTIPYKLDETFTLKIEFKGEKYIAKESLISVSSIERVEQETVNLFGNESVQLEAHAYDPIDERNYSFFEFIQLSRIGLEIPEYNVFRDDFSNGGEYYGFLLDSNLKKGDSIRIRQYGLSNIGYNYWYLLILQNTQQGGPFQTNPVNLVGNIINESNPNLNPLGYFRISEISEVNYIIK